MAIRTRPRLGQVFICVGVLVCPMDTVCVCVCARVCVCVCARVCGAWSPHADGIQTHGVRFSWPILVRPCNQGANLFFIYTSYVPYICCQMFGSFYDEFLKKMRFYGFELATNLKSTSAVSSCHQLPTCTSTPV